MSYSPPVPNVIVSLSVFFVNSVWFRIGLQPTFSDFERDGVISTGTLSIGLMSKHTFDTENDVTAPSVF